MGTRQFLKGGGEIDPEGNCILIEKRKAHKAWVKAIKTLVEHPEYVTMLKNNLAKHIEQNYNLETWTAKRAEWYKQIIQK